MNPHFICIGAQKAGTAWLSQCLMTHPNLWNPGIKELHFFDNLNLNNQSALLSSRKLKKIIRKTKNRKLLISESLLNDLSKSNQISSRQYLELFELTPEQCKSWEITPSYSTMGERKIKYMKNLLPETKFLYIIRDPIDRAMSSLRMWLEKGFKKEEPQEKTIGRWMKRQLDGGRYSLHLRKISELLDSNNRIMYLPFGLIKSDPSLFLHQVEDHIKIQHHDYNPSLFEPYHQTSKSISIPEEAEAHITKELEQERTFLRDFLGSEFSKKIS